MINLKFYSVKVKFVHHTTLGGALYIAHDHIRHFLAENCSMGKNKHKQNMKIMYI